MNNGTTAPPGYVLPSRPRWQGGWNVRALLGAVVTFVMVASAASQWLAAQLNNPVEMGDPSIFEIHVIRAFRIASLSKSDTAAIHQNEIRRTNDAKQVPAFIQEGIHDWPV